jgi:hypothetical protein
VLDVMSYGVPVGGTWDESLQDEQVERPLQHFAA